MIRASGADYFNPDEAARAMVTANPGIRLEAANAAAWEEGRRLLEAAISARREWAFETTLGGRTITALLSDAIAAGLEVRMWFVGLSSPELHRARVRARVAAGGHDIPEARIRERYDRSRLNLIGLLPRLTEVKLFDNSAEADPKTGQVPAPVLVLHLVRGRVAVLADLTRAPEWAKPILAAALGDGRA